MEDSNRIGNYWIYNFSREISYLKTKRIAVNPIFYCIFLILIMLYLINLGKSTRYVRHLVNID